MTDIGNITYGIRANTKDAYDIWMMQPLRRSDFGDRELLDIKEAYVALSVLLREIDKQQPALKVVSNHG